MEAAQANLTPQDLAEIGKKAFPIELSAEHGFPNPHCVTVAWDECGDYVYEYLKDTDNRYWFREYVKGAGGKLVPYEEAVFGPIRAKAKEARRRMQEAQEKEKEAYRHKDIEELRKMLAGIQNTN